MAALSYFRITLSFKNFNSCVIHILDGSLGFYVINNNFEDPHKAGTGDYLRQLFLKFNLLYESKKQFRKKPDYFNQF